jgi:PIN domain nuclease of toxin-antitoxin system
VNALSAAAVAEIFTGRQTKNAASPIPKTERYGRSLGSRACLTLAIVLKAPVHTAEQLERNLKLDVAIYVIR